MKSDISAKLRKIAGLFGFISSKPRKVTKVWTTRTGEQLRICDMTDEHLVNAMGCLERHACAARARDVDMFIHAIRPTAEMASLAHDQAMEDLAECDLADWLPPLYWDLVKEWERRNWGATEGGDS